MTQAAKPINRPLSPHLQVYRLPLAAWLSVMHRVTGVGLTIGTVLLTWWVASAAYGPSAYDQFVGFLGSPVGYFLLFGFSAALFYHLCNGIRHLFWDIGKNFEIAETNRANIIVIVAALAATALTWFMALR